MNIVAALTAALAAAGMSGGIDLKALDRDCAQVRKAYPVLMLAVMAEGPTNCGAHTGDDVDCDAGGTAEQAARQARRLELRKQQEAVFERADAACALYAAHRKLETAQVAAAAGVALARKVGTSLPSELHDPK